MLFIPYNKTLCIFKIGYKIVPAPYYLIFTYPFQFIEVSFIRSTIIPLFFLMFLADWIKTYSYPIGRIDNRQIERSRWKLSQEIHTIIVVYVIFPNLSIS